MSLKDESFISLNHYEIAVVDDDRFYHGKMRELLMAFFPNATVSCFISGNEILKDDKEYSFLIIDVLLDGENGIALSDSADLLLHHIGSIPQQNVLLNACLYHCCVELCQLFCYCVYYITFLPIRQVATERCTVF